MLWLGRRGKKLHLTPFTVFWVLTAYKLKLLGEADVDNPNLLELYIQFYRANLSKDRYHPALTQMGLSRWLIHAVSRNTNPSALKYIDISGLQTSELRIFDMRAGSYFLPSLILGYLIFAVASTFVFVAFLLGSIIPWWLILIIVLALFLLDATFVGLPLYIIEEVNKVSILQDYVDSLGEVSLRVI